MIKRFWALVLCLVMIVSMSACRKKEVQTSSIRDGENLVITVFDVGKADAILIEVETTTILIDTGEDADQKKLLTELEERDIDHLDLLVITHYDKDHLGSADEILRTLKVDKILIPDYEGEGKAWEIFEKAIRGKDNVLKVSESITSVTITMDTQMNEASFTIYPAEDPEELMEKAQAKDKEFDNEMSLVCLLTYGDCRFLFTGDVEGKRLGQMLSSGTDWSADWIKLPHHGDYSKKLKSLLEETGASYGVISTSKQEPPEDKLLEALKELKIETYQTTQGDIVTICDGTTIQVVIKE